MNSAVLFFIGCITFALMMVIKIPIKRMIFLLVGRIVVDEERHYIVYKRWNTVLLFVTLLVAAVIYYFIGKILEIDHYKWCCSMKAGAIAIAMYVAYKQWFGEY